MEYLLFALTGVVAGTLAGLLGVGGGIVTVPALVFIYSHLGYNPEHIMHLALGTSLANIVFSSVSSFRAHHKRGAVLWPVVWRITLGILVGAYLGSILAAWLSTNILKGFFAVFLTLNATQMLVGKKPKPSRTLPGPVGMFGSGGIIGAISSLVGIGGGIISVPFFVWCNMAVHQAIGTASAVGFPIAISGTIGYIVNGWGVAGLPAHTFGFVHWPSLIAISALSVCFAPLGAKLAHAIEPDRIKKGFACFMLLVAARLFYSLF